MKRNPVAMVAVRNVARETGVARDPASRSPSIRNIDILKKNNDILRPGKNGG
jgi:ribosomal protein L19